MEEKEKKYYLSMFNGERGAERNPTNFQRRDDGSHIYDNTEEYYEWWYFDASFDNDYHIVITYHYRNVFLKPMIPSLQFFIYKPDGTRIDRYEINDPEKIFASPDHCDIRMGDSWVKDNGDHYELYIKIKGMGAHLILKRAVPPWKPGSGLLYENDENGIVAGWVVPMPNADIEGELFLKDETIKVKGSGYHDHNWGNYHSHRIFTGWYWGRIHNEKFTVDYGWVLPREKDAPVVSPLLIARKNEIVLSTDMMQVELDNIEKDEQFGQEYAKTLKLTSDTSGVKFSLILNTQRIIESMQLPKVTDWNHYYYRFIADYKMDVEVDGVKESMNGELLHELMLL